MVVDELVIQFLSFRSTLLVVGVFFLLLFLFRHLSALLSGKQLGEYYFWNVLFLDILLLFVIMGLWLFAEPIVTFLANNFSFGMLGGGL